MDILNSKTDKLSNKQLKQLDFYLISVYEKKQYADKLLKKNKKMKNKFLELYSKTCEDVYGVKPDLAQEKNNIHLHMIEHFRIWIKEGNIEKTIFLENGLAELDACFTLNPELRFDYKTNIRLLKIPNIFQELQDLLLLMRETEKDKNYAMNHKIFYFIQISSFKDLYIQKHSWISKFLLN
jgi:hypothetical protein